MFWTTKKESSRSSPIAASKTPLAISLEPRMLFDGAVMATVSDAASDTSPSPDGTQAHSTSEISDNPMPLAATADQRQEVVFIDGKVSDKQLLIDGIKPGVEIVILDSNKDGLQQIADYLQNREGIDAIHILSHGDTGRILLGDTWLDKNGIENRSELLVALGSALSENGDILLYGCNVGVDGAGAEFIQAFAAATNADIAASNDLTGHSVLQGNWVLEVSTGRVEASPAVLASATDNYLYTLEPVDQDFETPPGSAPYSFTGSQTIDGVTYTLVSPAGGFSTITATDDFSITPQDPGKLYGYDLALVFNLDTGNAGMPGPLDARITSADGNEFKLVSMEIDTGTNMGTSPNLTIKGYLNGVEVASDTVNTSASDSTGSITYTKNAVPGGSGGTLTFSSAWQYIDEFRITGNDTIVAVDDLNFAPAVLPNAAPTIGNLNGDSVNWTGVGNTVRLDVGSNASLADAELGALNGGNGNWSGASLVIQRDGTAVSSDVLGFDTSGALFTVSGSNLQSGGLTFATFTNTGGVLTITFTSSGTTATTALINDVAQRITYRSDTPAGDAAISFTLNDGAGGSASATTTVTSDVIYVTNTNDTATISVSNGVSFSEAVAIAAADVTGSQTIVFASNLAGLTLNLNTVSINESLTFDMTQANGLTLTGGTITLAGGTTQVFNVSSSYSATISSLIVGSGALTKTGFGNLTLAGSGNTFSGATSISAGTLTVSGGDALANATSVSISAGATLALASNEAFGNLSGAGSVTLGNFNLTSTQTADTTFSGSISGNGGVTFNQAGAATYATTLSGTNTYTGATILANFGWLKLDGEASMSNSSAVRVNGNGVLTLLSDQTIGSLASSGAGASIQLGSHTLTAGGDNTTTSVLGVISGTGSLVKQGSGALTLSGSNTYSGTTTVSGGTLSITSDSNLGGDTVTLAAGAVLAVTGATTVDNAIVLSGNATVSNSANATLSGGISGAHTLTKSGAGTLTLSGTNTYSATTVNAGTLSVAGDSNLGSGVLTLDGATFNVTANSSTIDNTIVIGSGGGTFNKAFGTLTLTGSLSGAGSITKTGAGQLSHSGSGTLTLDGANVTTASGSGSMTLGSNIVLANGGGIFDVTGGDITLNGNISGSGSLTRQGGSNLLWLAGENSHTGTQLVTSGWLVAASSTAFGTGQIILSNGTTLAFNSGTASFANNLVLDGNATLRNANPNNTVTTLTGVISESGGSRNLTVTGGTGTNNAIILTGTNTYTGTTTLTTGTLQITNADNISSAGITLGSSSANLNISGSNVTLSNNINLTGSATISNANAVTLSGVISGNATLAKSGIGELTLSGSNTNTGTTTVSAGTLVVDGSTSSATNVASGATLAGSGTLGGNVTVQSGGTLSPGGAGVGTLTVNGNLTLNSGSTLALNINGVTAGTGYDRIVVNGTVDVSGAALAVTHGYAAGSGDSYTVIVNDAADAVTGTFSGVSEGNTFNATGNGTQLTASYIGGSGNDLTLSAPSAPTITNVSSSTANGTYKIGDVITINVQFNSAVNVTGTPTLTLETGATDRVLSYVSGSGSDTLSFSYTVQAGDSSADLDYASTSALSLNGGSIRDGADQAAVLTLAAPGAAGSLGANKALVVDGVRPTATSITLSDTALRIGETATVTVTFNERVSGLDIADFSVANGSLSSLSSSDGGLTWTATFTPSANVSDATNLITLDNTGVMDLAGNIGSGSTNSANYAIDTKSPTASIVFTDTALKAGQSTTVTITFSEDVTGVDLSDFALATTGSASGTLLSLVQVDARTYRITIGGVTGQGTLGLSLMAAGSGIVDGVGNAMLSNFSSASYTLGGLNDGDPEFRANPTPNVPTMPSAPPQPNVPSAPPSSTTSPLLPPSLFEQPTLGSGVPTLGNIFINNGALAPSYIAQVFASSDSGIGNGSGMGFLGFGGGDGGVFGTSSFSSMFNKDVPLESGGIQLRWGTSTGNGLGGGEILGAPTLSQQLQEIGESEQRQVRDLAWALGEIPLQMPQA